jgi:hypothetical protein
MRSGAGRHAAKRCGAVLERPVHAVKALGHVLPAITRDLQCASVLKAGICEAIHRHVSPSLGWFARRAAASFYNYKLSHAGGDLKKNR